MKANIGLKHKIIFLIPFIILIATLQLYGGEQSMRPLYTLNTALMERLEPKLYPTKNKKIEGVFEVPVDNAIITNKISNALTLIHFKENKLKFETIKKKFLDYVSSGNDIYLPIFSEDTIGYSIGRGFLMFNIKNKEFNYYSIAGGFNYKISQIELLDPINRIFVFKIRDLTEKTPMFLRMMDLSGKDEKIIMEKDVGDCGITIRDKTIFMDKENKISAINDKFEEIEHPFSTIFNKEKPKDYGMTSELVIHPTLPFAIIEERKRRGPSRETEMNTWCVSWRESDMKSDKPKMVKILSEDSVGYSFSYDGKWLTFMDATTSPKNLIMMPVDPELPYFIGKPIFLGQMPGHGRTNGGAMTRNPSGLVISGCDDYEKDCWLKKWDFTEAEKLLEKNKKNDQ